METNRDFAKDILNKRWNTLKDYKWRWEFIRRSPMFIEDSNPFRKDIQQYTFIDIWGLPHPGTNAAPAFLYLKDFKGLLEDILTFWLNCEEMGREEAVKNILHFAKAMNLASEHPFYRDHSLHFVGIVRNSIGGPWESFRKWKCYAFCKIMLPHSMRKKELLFEEEIEKSFPIFESTRQYVKANLYRLEIKVAIPKNFNKGKICSVEEDKIRKKLLEIIIHVLNQDLEPVKHWNERNRKDSYRQQIAVIDVENGKRSKDSVLNEFEGNDDNYIKWQKQALKKIKILEKAALIRKEFFSPESL